MLTTGGARRGGAGYLNYLAREPLPTDLVVRAYPDVVPITDDDGVDFDAVVVGPGSPFISTLPHSRRVIIDGGALAKISEPCPRDRIWILTPHEGEAKRMGFDPSAREECAKQIASDLNCVALLKGPRSIIATPREIVYIDDVAGPELSTAGTGDVLAGFIASMIAAHRPDSLKQAGEIVAHSVEIYSAAARLSLTQRAPLVATDLLEALPMLLAQGEISL